MSVKVITYLKCIGILADMSERYSHTTYKGSSILAVNVLQEGANL